MERNISYKNAYISEILLSDTPQFKIELCHLGLKVMYLFTLLKCNRPLQILYKNLLNTFNTLLWEVQQSPIRICKT